MKPTQHESVQRSIKFTSPHFGYGENVRSCMDRKTDQKKVGVGSLRTLAHWMRSGIIMHYNCTKFLLMYYIKSVRFYILILKTVLTVLVRCQIYYIFFKL